MAHRAIYRSILEDMREGVMSLNIQGSITTFNAAAEQILELPRDWVLGRVLAEVFLELDGTDEFVEAILAAVYQDATTHQKRVEFPTASGMRQLAVTTSFLRDSGDSVFIVRISCISTRKN